MNIPRILHSENAGIYIIFSYEHRRAISAITPASFIYLRIYLFSQGYLTLHSRRRAWISGRRVTDAPESPRSDAPLSARRADNFSRFPWPLGSCVRLR